MQPDQKRIDPLGDVFKRVPECLLGAFDSADVNCCREEDCMRVQAICNDGIHGVE